MFRRCEIDLRVGGWRAHGHDRNPDFKNVCCMSFGMTLSFTLSPGEASGAAWVSVSEPGHIEQAEA